MPARLNQLAVCLSLGWSVLVSCSVQNCLAESRDQLLQQTPLAEVDGQELNSDRPDADYTAVQMLYTPEQEDPLDHYRRSRDGEWIIPGNVDRNDRWLRLLVLAPARPLIVDIAIEINGEPFREPRENWIDRLLAEAQQTFLLRTGAATADAEGVTSAEASQEDEAPADQATADSAEQGAPQSEDNEAEAADEESEVVTVETQGRQARTLFKRLINYLAADQTTADREEVRWLLAEWTGGPTLLTTSPAFAWRRAQVAPLWHTLDRDGDRVLSAEEIANLEDSLKKSDNNQDDILDLTELFGAAERSKELRHPRSHSLVVNLDQQTDWGNLLSDLHSAYPLRGDPTAEMPLLERVALGDRKLEPRDLVKLFSLAADIVYRVNFGGERAKLALLAVEESADWRLESATSQVITVEHPEAYMELSVAQGEVDPENSNGDMQQTQVAIGALVDGFPLFRLADQDGNRQLTLRERRETAELVKSLDRNGDGQVVEAELPTPIRLAITLGPFAHRQLAQPIAASRGSKEATAKVPPWFSGMDRNHDGDLSRREFQGSPAQFAQFDQDGDGLISSREAMENSAQESSPTDE